MARASDCRCAGVSARARSRFQARAAFSNRTDSISASPSASVDRPGVSSRRSQLCRT